MGAEHRDNGTAGAELDPRTVHEMVRRIVAVAEPERVIMFGSAARGEMGPHSDVDLLVVKGGEYRSREVALRIRRALRDLRLPLDVIVATPGQIERYGDCFALVYYPALREGQVLYAA
jgi:predicted nucleotidyltransferase